VAHGDFCRQVRAIAGYLCNESQNCHKTNDEDDHYRADHGVKISSLGVAAKV